MTEQLALPPPEQDPVERAVDTQGISYELARQLYGDDESQIPNVPATAKSPKLATARSRAARGPRYDGDSEIDLVTGKPFYAHAPERLTDEQVAERQAVLAGSGNRAAKVAGILAEMKVVKKLSGGDITLQLALTKARADKREKERKERGLA